MILEEFHGIKQCAYCPLWQRNFRDPCECTHPGAPNSPKNWIGPHDAAKRVPKWCPLRKKPYVKTVLIDGKVAEKINIILLKKLL